MSTSTSTRYLTAEALDLPADERAQLLEMLIASFEPRSDVQQAWMSLAPRRRHEVNAGEVAMVPEGEALARVRTRIA